MPDNKPKDLTFEERVELFRATADNPAARHDLQSNLGISVFIPRLC